MTDVKLEQTAATRWSQPVDLECPDERVIEPARRRLKVRDLPAYAPIIRVLAARDLKVKYKQSILGPLWLIFQPLALLAAFLVAFRGLAGIEVGGQPYVLFALVGLSVWAFFQAAMTIGTASLIGNTSLIRLTPCPRAAFPIAALIASLPAFAVTIVAALVVGAATAHLSPRAVLLPIALAWLLLLTAGVVAISASLTVRYRDINSALPFLLQVAIFLAPVGYPLAELSSTVRALVGLNPVTGVMEAFRWMMLPGYESSVEPIAVSLAVTMAVVVGGWLLFTRLETTMADDI